MKKKINLIIIRKNKTQMALLFGAGLIGLMATLNAKLDAEALQLAELKEEQELSKSSLGAALNGRRKFTPFGRLADIIYSPVFPSDSTPFISNHRAIGNLGYEKNQYSMRDGLMYEVYAGTEHHLLL